MRPIRCETLPGVYELSARITGDELLMAPSTEVNAAILETLATAHHQSNVALHAFSFLSNHFHMIVSIREGAELSRFMQLFQGRLARAINRIRDRRGAVWQRRFHSVLIADDEATQVARLRYVLAHGVKEGLVARARDWPGVTSTRALADGEVQTAACVNRAAYWRASRRAGGGTCHMNEFMEKREIPLAPLPCWADLPAPVRRQRVLALLDDIESEKSADLDLEGAAPLGVAAIRRTDPFSRVGPPKPRPPTLVHAAGKTRRRRLVEELRAVWEAWRERAHAMLAAYVASGGRLWPFANVWTARRLLAAPMAL